MTHFLFFLSCTSIRFPRICPHSNAGCISASHAPGRQRLYKSTSIFQSESCYSALAWYWSKTTLRPLSILSGAYMMWLFNVIATVHLSSFPCRSWQAVLYNKRKSFIMQKTRNNKLKPVNRKMKIRAFVAMEISGFTLPKWHGFIGYILRSVYSNYNSVI